MYEFRGGIETEKLPDIYWTLRINKFTYVRTRALLKTRWQSSPNGDKVFHRVVIHPLRMVTNCHWLRNIITAR